MIGTSNAFGIDAALSVNETMVMKNKMRLIGDGAAGSPQD